MDNEIKKKNILLGAVIGDALGYTLEGFTAAHVHNHFRDMAGYTDPAPALKGRMDKWRMPGLYSSISQFMILLAKNQTRRMTHFDGFIEAVSDSPVIPECDFGVFRNPDTVEKRFIRSVKNSRDAYDISSSPSARIIAAAIPLAFINRNLIDTALETIIFIKLFTEEISTVACAIAATALLQDQIYQINEYGKNPISSSLLSVQKLLNEIEMRPDAIFQAGINPDNLAGELLRYYDILNQISNIDDKDGAEENICAILNRSMKNHIKRASVNLPVAQLPYVMYLLNNVSNDPEGIVRVSREGGSASSIAALYGAFSSSFELSPIPAVLVQNIVNRKKIVSIVESLSVEKNKSLSCRDFLASEASLTIKEQQERKSKMKHVKTKSTKRKTAKERETELSRRIVGSWTKIDKARWKRDRKKIDREPED